jgi:hypothetical protein
MSDDSTREARRRVFITGGTGYMGVHWWPYLLLPVYKAAEVLPKAREGALRLGLVTLPQMVTALLAAVQNPPQGTRIATVPGIRSAMA